MRRFLTPRFALLGLALVATPALSAAAAHGLIQPGYWETTNRVLSPFPTKKVEMRCITPAEVGKFMEGPSNHIYKCTYPTRIFQDGKIVLKGQCVDKKGAKVNLSGEGTYSPSSFHLVADVQFKLAGLPLSGRASTDARRIGDVCPPGAKRG